MSTHQRRKLFGLLYSFLAVVCLTGISEAMDSDGDGLSDKLELELGTEPARPDTDGDGLLDGWEVLGYELGDFVEPLASYGCDPFHKDVLVEIDWMESPGGDRLPNALIAYQAAVDVWRVFQSWNETSDHEIHIHFDLGPDIEELIPDELHESGPDFLRFRVEPDPGKVIPYQDSFPARPLCQGSTCRRSLYDVYYDPAYFRPSRRNLFYYVVFAEQHDAKLSGNSPVHPYSDSFADELSRRAGLKPAGIQVGAVFRSPRPNVDPEVLRYVYSVNLLHELGHGFGLGHGGATPNNEWDNTNNKPNYPSIMNYRFQFWGVDLRDDAVPVMGFSSGQHLGVPLVECKLFESLGMGQLPNEHIQSNLGVRHLERAGFGANLDWDEDGELDKLPVSRDLDLDGTIGSMSFTDHDDWGKFVRDGFAGVGWRAFRGCGLSCARGRELVRFPGDFNGDGRTDLFLLHGRTGALVLEGETGELLLAQNQVYEDEIPGLEGASWALSSADDIVVVNLDGEQGEELVIHRGSSVGIVDYLEEGLAVTWQGQATVSVAEDEPVWEFTKEDRLWGFARGASGSSVLLVCDGREAAVVAWTEGLELEWKTPSDLRLWTDGEPAHLNAGRSHAERGSSFFIRSAHSLCEVDARDGAFAIRRADRDGTLPARNPEDPGWVLDSSDCLFAMDLDGDGTQEVLLKSPERLGVLREEGEDLLLAWQTADNLGSWTFHDGEIVYSGQFIPGGGEEVLISGGGRWLGLAWDADEQTMEILAIADDSVLDPTAGNAPWYLEPDQQVITGRFLEGEASLILAQDENNLLVAALTEDGFQQLGRHDGMVGGWSLSNEDLFWVVNADLDPTTELFVKKGYLLGVLDLSRPGPDGMTFATRYDIASNALEPLRLFLRGDTNGDGELDLSDVINLLQFLFLRQVELACRDTGDADDNGELDISDVIRILGHLFLGQAPPPPPGPKIPGIDPTLDPLPCK